MKLRQEFAVKNPNKWEGVVEVKETYYGFLLMHKRFLIRRIEENCNYNTVDKSDITEVSEREKIVRKYLWLLRYHNSICKGHGFAHGLFAHRLGYDPNTLRLIIEAENKDY